MQRKITIRVTAGHNDCCASAWDENGDDVMVSARMAKVDEDRATVFFAGRFEVDAKDLGGMSLADLILSRLPGVEVH